MTSWKQLSRPLRLAIAAPWCLLAVLTAVAATPATRALLLDPANRPTADVSFASSHWTGTLDAARLPSDPVASSDIHPASIGTTFGGITYLDISGYANVYNQLSVLASYGHGTSIRPVDPDGGLVLVNDANGNADNLSLGSLAASGVISGDGGLVASDGGGGFVAASGLTSYGVLAVSGSSQLDGNFITTDGSGNVQATSLFLNGSFAAWGATPPSSQPATPATLADVIAILHAYGLSQ